MRLLSNEVNSHDPGDTQHSLKNLYHQKQCYLGLGAWTERDRERMILKTAGLPNSRRKGRLIKLLGKNTYL